MARKLIVLAPGQPPDAGLARQVATVLARADHQAVVADDDRGLYGDLFARARDDWPAGALTRQLDADDAEGHAWLRADPAYFRVEPGSVRLMACGDLGQDQAEVDQLLATLCPLFGDEGFELTAPHPARWYLRPFAGNVVPDLPRLPVPEQALGGDLFELWPEDELHRRWRRLFSEVQIVLAQHPVNQRRIAAGQPAINGLWFWGAGTLPASIVADVDAVISDDPVLAGLALASGIALARAWASGTAAEANGSVLLDLRATASADRVLADVLHLWRAGAVALLDWRTDSGRWLCRRWHRFRFWRR